VISKLVVGALVAVTSSSIANCTNWAFSHTFMGCVVSEWSIVFACDAVLLEIVVVARAVGSLTFRTLSHADWSVSVAARFAVCMSGIAITWRST
jgi:hypothetical protein